MRTRQLVLCVLVFSLAACTTAHAQETTDFTIDLERYGQLFDRKVEPGLRVGSVRFQPNVRREQGNELASLPLRTGRYHETTEAQLEAFVADRPNMRYVVRALKRQLKEDGTEQEHDPIGALAPEVNEKKFSFGFSWSFD